LLWVVLAVQLVILVLVLRPASAPSESTSDSGLGADQLRDLAQKLERQGLVDPAVRTWKQYLRVRDGDAAGAAAIWYRMGKIQQDAGNYEAALESYYHSEALARMDNLADEMGRRVQECLQAMGKFAALRYELADRVSVGDGTDSAADDVLAEIGPVKITRQELDRQIENMAEQQLAQIAPFMSPDALKQQKEAILKRFSTDQGRMQVLNQFIAQEILYRKAREDGLTENPDVRALLQQAERDILAQQVLARAVADRVTITPEDVRTYYEANRDSFVEPASAQVAQIVVPDTEKAEAVRNSLAAGKPFEELAKEVSTDEKTAQNGGVLPGRISADAASVPGVGTAPDFVKAVFATPAGDVAAADVTTPAGVHVIKVLDRREPRQKPFEDVRDDAARQLRSRKEREVQEQLMKQLRDTYDVVIHTSRFNTADKPETDE
jgi:peptidyl-prolyl cis-trans isomerase C